MPKPSNFKPNSTLSAAARTLLTLTLLAPLPSCGPRPVKVVFVEPHFDPALLTPCGGYTGPTPKLDAQLIAAAKAERAGRLDCNGKIAAMRQALASQKAQGQQ